MLLVALGVFALLQLWYLHKGLVLADPTLVCPSAFCFYNLSSIVNGLVYFDQFTLISPPHLGLVVVGISSCSLECGLSAYRPVVEVSMLTDLKMATNLFLRMKIQFPSSRKDLRPNHEMLKEVLG